MKTPVIATVLFSLALTAVAASAASPLRFRYYMHEIFKTYRNTYLAIQSGNYDVAAIHLRHAQEYVDDISKDIPNTGAKGVKWDKPLIVTHLASLRGTITSLQQAVKNEDAGQMRRLSQDMLNVCVGCHQRSKLNFLFRLWPHKSLFGEYMHQISDYYGLVEIHMESQETGEAVDYLKIINHYLSLLEDTIPEKGPSGVIMDKPRFLGEIRKVEGFNELIMTDIKDKKWADLSLVKGKLNDLCVACHEPGRIK